MAQPALQHIAHRPWPLPRGPWVMKQMWHELLFAHWPVPAEKLRALLPPGLELDTFDGRAYLGVVPFRMTGVRLRATPPLPWLSAFPEINVRTYVTRDAKPGVWFFSLDAARLLAVKAARLAHLSYFHARMHSQLKPASPFSVVEYHSARVHPAAPAAEFHATYRPAGEIFQSSPGSLDHWLTERYCLYAADKARRLFRLEIHHPPWPLQPAAAEIITNTMADQIAVALEGAPILHYAQRLEVLFWPLRRLPW